MELLVVLTFACFQNYMRAKLGNLDPVKWTILTLIACLITSFLGSVILVSIMVARNPAILEVLKKPPVSNDVLLKYFENSGFIMPDIFMILCGLGGYLLIRYLLDKRVNLQP